VQVLKPARVGVTGRDGYGLGYSYPRKTRTRIAGLAGTSKSHDFYLDILIFW
jgi:hypothetical protein